MGVRRVVLLFAVLIGLGTAACAPPPPPPPPPPVDTEPPELGLPGDLSAVAGTVSGAQLGAQVSFAVSASDLVDGDVEVTCTRPSGSVFPLGATVVTCSASDAAGNTSSGSFTVTVTPPGFITLFVPSVVFAQQTSFLGGVATYEAFAFDAAGNPMPLFCAPPSGSLFPGGTTFVTCTATDEFGNSFSQGFQVVVR